MMSENKIVSVAPHSLYTCFVHIILQHLIGWLLILARRSFRVAITVSV